MRSVHWKWGRAEGVGGRRREKRKRGVNRDKEERKSESGRMEDNKRKDGNEDSEETTETKGEVSNRDRER